MLANPQNLNIGRALGHKDDFLLSTVVTVSLGIAGLVVVQIERFLCELGDFDLKIIEHQFLQLTKQ